MKKNYSDYELVSLNEKLQNEYSIQQLEIRLETDPLFFVNFLQEEMMEYGEEGATVCKVDGALTICKTNQSICSAQESLICSGLGS